MRGRHFLATGSTLAAICLAATPLQAQTAQRYDIAEQDLATALKRFAAISGREIVAASSVIDRKRSAAVRGDYPSDEALRILLSRARLRADVVEGAFVIRPLDVADRQAPQDEDSKADIVVTGTRIRGAPIASPLIVRTSDELRDQGKTSLGDAVRSIPQSFGGGQNPGVGINVPSNSGVDVGGGSSINLRGLGSDATLTLLDGRRLAFTASAQSIDVSSIPLGAVDRLEIVPDGASAIYGSDAVAGVANIILRRRFDGIVVGARLGTATDGGDFQQQYWSTGGANWSGGSLVASYEYGSNTAITSAQRDYAAIRRPGVTLFPALRHHSATLAGQQSLTDTLKFDVDALYNVRWSSTTFPTVPSGNLNLGRATNAFEDRSWVVAPSLKLALGGGWRATLAGTLGQERVEYAQTQCAPAGCSITGSGFYRNTERSAEVGGDGPLFRLPGGDARLAVGAGYRAIGFVRFAANGSTVNTDHAQDSYFAYGEMELPIVSRAQGVAMIDRLTATGAVRYERYPGLGGVATPKLGLIYAPSPDLDIKASWGKSFRAPTLYQQYAPRNVVIFPPAFVGGTGLPANAGVFLVLGGNPALKPERATTWSATLALHPQSLPGTRLEVSYFNVDYRNRIVAPITFQSQALSNPIYASQITRSPSPAALAALIAGAGNFLNITGVPYDPANIVAVVDNGSVNAGHQSARGVDIVAEYRTRLSSDQTLRFSLAASYLDSAQQLSTSQPTIPLSGRIFSPPHWRGQGAAAWSGGPLTLATTLNYTGGVLDARTTSPVAIDGMTTLDLTARLRVDSGPAAFRGIELTVSVANLFNAKPSPIVTSNQADTPYDSTNFSPVGRLISVGISKKF